MNLCTKCPNSSFPAGLDPVAGNPEEAYRQFDLTAEARRPLRENIIFIDQQFLRLSDGLTFLPISFPDGKKEI